MPDQMTAGATTDRSSLARRDGHRAFVAGLGPDVLRGLRTRADAPGLRHLAGHLVLIAVFGVWIARGWPLWQGVLVAQGVAICFLFTLAHEATHKTPFATGWLNEWAGRLAGFTILLPFGWFRYFHLAHHRHTNIPGRDPELLAGGHPQTRAAFAWHVTGLPYWGGMARQVLRNALGGDPGDFVPARARRRIRVEARWMLAGHALAGLSLALSPLVLWLWWLPCLLGQPFLRLYLLAEHGRCPFVADMLENSRTTHTNRMVRFLAWNMPYHAEHHSLPDVPFHRLPELHALMRGWHRVTAPGYTAFTADYAARLR